MSQWKYTEKGWFIFEYCTAQPPELTEVVDAYEMIRVKPKTSEYREMEEKYLDIIGYQGNNLLCSEWSEDQIEGLDFNGLYEYFYMEEYGREIDTEKCARGIPQEEFESLLTKYLPVTAEQLREYASYDPENDTGLLCTACMKNIQFGILQGNVNVNMGSILENLSALR